ncbi:MAG: HAMP domain-containing histidine kinase [Lachnospiraceae bacterium]|nr:HAMP domain-containing histidine kinase [Lachnospiraceae bacterium]
MGNWLWVVVMILAAVILALCIKIYVMRKAAEEIRKELTEKLAVETNTLITISSRDKCMCALAENLNKELRILNRKRHYFEQGDLRLKEAVVNISHDIRTPLTALNGYLELLRKLMREMAEGNGNLKEKTETAERYLDIMENRTGVLTQLTGELFRYSIAASEEQEFSYEDVILNHVLEESISAYYAALNNAKITPVINMPNKEVKCRLNKNALTRIFGNILGNAIKYSNGDLEISLSEEGEILFSNHAPALDEVQVGKLFDRFYTVDTAAKSTGIGLSIARMLTEQMGGTISADYQEGVLSIRLLFPVSRL